ncbi:MAG: response regulator [Thermoplasmatota archaeon]
MKVLLVDDDESLLELAELFLEKEEDRFELVTTSDPKKALEKIKEDHVEAVVSDYKMPKMDGLELLEKVKEENKNIPFIILTGRGREEVAMEALNKGADHYLQKGGDVRSQFGVLADEIKREIENKRNKVELRKSTSRHRDFFETSRDCLFVSNIKGELIDCNHKTLEFFGFESKEEMMKKNIRYLYAKQEDRDIYIKKLKEKQKIEDFPVVFRTKEGTLRPALINAVCSSDVKDDTEIRGVICPVDDMKCTPTTFRERFEEIHGMRPDEMDYI